MIRQDEVFYIGKVSKVRGLRGEVEILFTDDVFDRGDADYLVLNMDGILVPYFWEEYRFKNDDTAIFQFEEAKTDIAARHLVGHEVYYPIAAIPHDDGADEPLSLRALVGFTITDEFGQTIGQVRHVDDRSQNVLLEILSPEGKEIILPFHEDLVADYSPLKRTLSLCLPEGILNLNL